MRHSHEEISLECVCMCVKFLLYNITFSRTNAPREVYNNRDFHFSLPLFSFMKSDNFRLWNVNSEHKNTRNGEVVLGEALKLKL